MAGRAEVGDPVDDFLGDAVAEQVVGLAADPVDLSGLGERDPGGWHDPDLADHPVAADAFLGGVVGAAGGCLGHQGHDGLQEFGLVFLDG